MEAAFTNFKDAKMSGERSSGANVFGSISAVLHHFSHRWSSRGVPIGVSSWKGQKIFNLLHHVLIGVLILLHCLDHNAHWCSTVLPGRVVHQIEQNNRKCEPHKTSTWFDISDRTVEIKLGLLVGFFFIFGIIEKVFSSRVLAGFFLVQLYFWTWKLSLSQLRYTNGRAECLHWYSLSRFCYGS